MTQQQQQTDGVIPPPENLEFPEATDTSDSDATWFAELSDLADITDGDALSNDSNDSTSTSTSTTPTYDLNLEDFPTFNLEDVDLTDIDLTNLDIDLSLAHLEANESNESNESSEPFYEPAPLSPTIGIDSFTFKHKCGYCGRPAGWQHNTRHFIQLRSGHRYACFACLCQRWRTRIPHNSPGLGLGLGLSHPLNTKNHHRRLPRRRILEQRLNKLKVEHPKSKSS